MLGLIAPLAVLAAGFAPPDTGCEGVDVAARLIDGGAVRVCEAGWGTTAYFAGHRARPLAGATVGFAAPPDVRVERTVATGATGYTVTFTLTNTSGTPLTWRPQAVVGGVEAVVAAGGFVQLRQPDQEITLTAGATAVHTVAVDLGQPRELLADISGPQSGPTLRVNVRVTDPRVVAGSVVRFSLGGQTGVAGTLAADGTGQLAAPWGGRLQLWFDADGDGVADADEPSAEEEIPAAPGFIPVDATWTPPPGYVPPQNPTVTVPFRRTYKVKGCAGKTVKLRLLDGTQVLAQRSAKLDRRCRLKTSFKVQLAQLNAAGPMTVELRLRGRVKRYALSF